MSVEALTTSEIEGEMLNRASVQSSIQRQLGFLSDRRKVQPAEQGISELMVDLYRGVDEALTEDQLFSWHQMVVSGRSDLRDIGRYRTSDEPMQVMSGATYAPKVHFEAPPSNRLPGEMRRFITWFNATAPGGKRELPALTRAALVHLYFVCIHPFEDGNGRIGRALAEKSLAQNLGQPSLIALAYTMERKRKEYYAALELNNKELEITAWMKYFANTVLEAQNNTIKRVDFYVAKAKFYERFRGRLNERQDKAVARMFKEGVDGFKGGLSADNYIAIAKISRATATRDLQNLVALGAFTKTGELRHTRYHLNIANEGRGS